MTKIKRILLSIGITIFGWILGGLGWTTNLGHPINTIFFLLGLGFMCTGLAFIVLTINKK